MRSTLQLLGGLAGAVLLVPLRAQTAPTVFRSAPGRFEVSALDADAARAVTSAADEAWRILAAPLALPEAFSSPVFVRLIAADEWRDSTPFRTIVESGAIVSLRLAWRAGMPESLIRRAVVQALLMRLAVAHHGVNERLVAPLWLEFACVGWWETRADAAQFDLLKYRSARMEPPALRALLSWQRGDEEDAARIGSATWLIAFLQAESGKAGEWPALLRRLLGGEEPLLSLAATFPGRFDTAEESELWWLTGFHHARRVRTVPVLDAAESRAELAALQRFVVAEGALETDTSATLRSALDHAREPFVGAELQRRSTELARMVPALHPFFRNAGLSLAEAFATRTAPKARRDEACRAFEADWRDAVELMFASRAALDAVESGGR